MGKKYRSEISMGIHESARELFEIGLISEARMREYDEMCLVEKPRAKPTPESFGAELEPQKTERITA